MTGLPSGTVTLLFTDIEGSTRLWDRDHAAMAQALARHDALLREAVAAHGGSVFKLVGDAVCAAFPTAPAALAAALAAQRALTAEPWAKTGPLRVRMALHTATVEPHGGDYTGPPLNRVARLLAAGHGGQVLLSAATQHLVRLHLPPDTTLLDLGTHRLRDLLEPEQVYQLVAPDLLDTFPPLKSLERHPTNLPLQPTALIGRDQELAEIEALLSRDDVRLATLTGPGGTGKTRLALQVAADLLESFADGAFVVDLAAITDPALVLPTIAATLGVRETGGQSLRDTLVAYFTDKHLLLLLDNVEQVRDAAPDLADLLGACPGLTLLATSRARLGLRAEHDYLVPPLPTPDPVRVPPLAALAQIASVALFVDRATAARHDFRLTEAIAPAVAKICARLDGLPLAIELAAARVKALSPRAILDRLTNRLKLLIGGARDLPQRQQTLRTTIAWSYDLLSPAEQALFRRLAVFAGGFSLEGAERVVGAAGDLEVDILVGVEVLVDQSLVRQVAAVDDEPRFLMLETIREFGLDQLDVAGEADRTRRAHAAWCLEVAETAAAYLTGPEQAAWLARLAGEHDNCRAALTALATTSEADNDAQLRLAGALWRFWYTHGHLSEGRRWLDQALGHEAATDTAPTPARATALHGSGMLAYVQGDYARAQTLHEASLAIRRELNDAAGIAASLYNLGLVAGAQGDYARAVDRYEESLAAARMAGDRRGIAAALHKLGSVADDQGDLTRATLLQEESLGILRELGDQRSVAIALNGLGLVAFAQRDYARAARLLEESLEILRQLGDQRGVATLLNSLGLVAGAEKDYDRAIALHEESLTIDRTMGDQHGIAVSLNNLGVLVTDQGNYARAVALHDESLRILQSLGAKHGLIESFEGIAALAAALARAEPAARLLGAAAVLRDTLGLPATPEAAVRNDRVRAALRAHLDEQTLNACLASGRALSTEDAVATALVFLQEAARLVPA